jgi:hypothetical protein
LIRSMQAQVKNQSTLKSMKKCLERRVANELFRR